MFEIVSNFFSTKGFMPHGMCLFWKPSVLWTLVIANAWIALSYLLIPIVLFHVYIKRKDIQYTWIFLLFAAFILLQKFMWFNSCIACCNLLESNLWRTRFS